MYLLSEKVKNFRFCAHWKVEADSFQGALFASIKNDNPAQSDYGDNKKKRMFSQENGIIDTFLS